ncbi:hypothetical protein CPB86DRAFT_876435 [Serendipita vermifera]|nr:hypothetical protein CPB86DRAFT_876435 [Serendipita vermifera]
MDLSPEELNYIITHVFLPLKLPQKHEAESSLKDGHLLSCAAQAAQLFCTKLESSGNSTPPSALTAWKLVAKMLDKAADLHQQQYLVETEVKAALLGMDINDILPLYIESQNAVVIFRKLRDDCLTFEHFEAMIPTEIVMKKANKIQVRFPSNPRLLVAFKPDVLASLANVLAYFSATEIDDALPKSKKGGSEHHETRNVPSTRYISEAVAGVLRGAQPTDGPSFQTTFITKRLDDHVLWKSTVKPWRRSPIWLLIRVALQTTLSEWGVADEVGYKAFQAYFMAKILKNALNVPPTTFTIDLLYSMNAKLARRLAKLGKCTEDNANRALKTSVKIVKEASDILKQRWDEVITQWEGRVQWTPPDPTAFEGCLDLSFANSQDYLRQVVKRRRELDQTLRKFDKAAIEKQLRAACAPRTSYIPECLPTGISGAELDVSLFDFESWVKDHLQEWTKSPSRSEKDCLPLSKIIDKYREVASSHYKNNPEGLSLMHLCIIELWVALDRLVAKWCPLLLDYSPEIPTNYLDPLLLPYFEQYQRLYQVQKYLQERHQKAAIKSNHSVLEQLNASYSFANRFLSLPMAASLRQLKEEIQTWAATRRSDKVDELESLNAEYNSLKSQFDHLPCIRLEVTKKQHKKRCEKCRLKRAASELRILPIEEPLPDDLARSNAIIFELRCPLPIAVWRDTVKRILQTDESESSFGSDLYPLSEYDPLNQFFQPAYGGHQISIASHAKSISKSHYGNKKQIPATTNQVFHKSAADFAIFDSLKRQWVTATNIPDLRPQCTLRVEDLYQPLQSYLDSTLHTPNQVIASQHECPTDISVDEYIAFGQLRSGNRLQWRNIIRAFRKQSLTFSECGVYFLILQAIWQAGPMGVEGAYREAHSDLMDEQFCREVLTELRTTLQLIKDNWTQSLFLACIVALTIRIHRFVQSEELQHNASSALVEARQIAFQWISSLRKSPSEQHGANNQRKQAMIGASLVLRATFDTETSDNYNTFRTNQEAVWYLYAGTIVSGHNIELLPSGVRLLALRDRRIRWKLYPYVSRICVADSIVLHQVLSIKWNHPTSGSNWISLGSPGGRWWCSTIRHEVEEMQQVVHVNIVDGSILVEGRTFERLPDDHMDHPSYKSLFASEEMEDIRCSTMKGMKYEGRYRGREVHLLLKGQDLIIRCREGEHVEEFIPAHILRGDLPSSLIDTNHYWYIEGSKTVEIRPKQRTWSRNEPRIWKAALQQKAKTISGRCTKSIAQGFCQLVDPHSHLYRHLNGVLRHLEPQIDNIVVTIEANDPITSPTIYLPRHDLTFCVTSSSLLECQSFPGFVVDTNYRQIGTLIGLETIISLRGNSDGTSQRKIIIPKGTLSSTTGLYGHPLTSIDLKDDRGYFIFEVDDLLGRLYSNRTIESDLFLSLLHALTSSPLPDHLTQRSGTSEALERLNNSSLYSIYSLSTDARSYLDGLASLTPQRTFYPSHLQVMETVKWHKALPPLSQHPYFLPFVQDILGYWRSLENFHSFRNLLDPICVLPGMDHLSARVDARAWMYHHPSRPAVQLRDLVYHSADCMKDAESQKREKLAFQVAHLSHPSTVSFPLSRTLRDTIVSWEEILGDHWAWDDISHWFPKANSMGEIWCSLYELCRVSKWPGDFKVTMILGILGYRETPFEILATLMAVASRPKSALPKCPIYPRLDLTLGASFDRSRLEQILKDHAVQYPQSEESKMEQDIWETMEERRERLHALYERELTQEINETIQELQSQWPDIPEELNVTEKRLLNHPWDYIPTIHITLLGPSQNRAFLLHIDHVYTVLSPFYVPKTSCKLYAPSPDHPLKVPNWSATPTLSNLMKRDPPTPRLSTSEAQFETTHSLPLKHQDTTDLDGLFDGLCGLAQGDLESLYLRNLRDSIEALTTSHHTLDSCVALPSSNYLYSLKETTKEDSATAFHYLQDSLLRKDHTCMLLRIAGILPVITPINLLCQLSSINRHGIPEKWKVLLVQYAAKLHDAKRAERMVHLFGTKRFSHLRQEMQYRREWDPLEFIDWLLIEVDTSLSIRPSQAEMAREMIHPSSHSNTVMQLNMGEGKSSVIVPLVSVSAINISKSLSRVIVPRTQIKQQFHILRQTITGLCDRRVIYLPFSRKLQVDETSVQQIQSFLQTAAQNGAIWLCEPEQILSLKLLGVDKLLRDQSSQRTGRKLVSLQSWLQSNTRDIIDESDDVLHTKQQVIYTIGKQKDPDAAPWRWESLQRLLGLFASFLSRQKVGLDAPGATITEKKEHKEAFPFIRNLQNDDSAHIVSEFVRGSIMLNEWSIKPSLIHLALQLVTEEPFPMEIYKILQKQCPETQSPTLQTLLLLRGILQKGILLHVFKYKRYRVNYGLDFTRSLLAVPYRAKDVPSPRSEFGHPDITILLTCLSYYYRGLDSETIRLTLRQLLKSGTPELTYSEWLRPCRQYVPEQLHFLSAVNMQDEKMLEELLFPYLKYNKLFIDSYLNWFVFPRQAKEFPSKLSSSGWDLAAKKPNLSTGFSGTNDGRFLLPTTIVQVDRPAQLHTNAKVLSCLLQKENKRVQQYSYNNDSSTLLAEVLNITPKPTVILDVGAQVLDRSNREFSHMWLDNCKDDPNIKAVVFFEQDELVVMTSDGLVQSLRDSPYSERLDQCIVYLDDAHTRGTDLRLPDAIAVVTLGPRITKDKLVQGSMRMRKLGQGQSVIFLASNEVAALIAGATGCDPGRITSKEVLLWTIKETWRQLQADIPAYAVQGHSYARREAAWKSLEDGGISHQKLAEQLCEQESRTLEELYGPDVGHDHSWMREYHSPKASNEVSRAIYQRCNEFFVFSMSYSRMDEEKEVELVHEKEVERVVERPQPVTAAEHYLHLPVKKFVDSGVLPSNSGRFHKIGSAFLHTSIPIPRGLQDAFSNLFVTEDFSRTVETPSYLSFSSLEGTMDDFIRPVEWLVVPNTSHPSFAVAFSPFEVNELFNEIKSSGKVRLHIFAAHTTLSMRPFDTFDSFTLPSQTIKPTFPTRLVHQINTFSGSIFIRDYRTYQDICKFLKLHFDRIEMETMSDDTLTIEGVTDSTFFVFDPSTQNRLGIGESGFKESPVPFLRKLLTARRHGQGLGPSHMGKLLYGVKLKEEDFVDNGT